MHGKIHTWPKYIQPIVRRFVSQIRSGGRDTSEVEEFPPLGGLEHGDNSPSTTYLNRSVFFGKKIWLGTSFTEGEFSSLATGTQAPTALLLGSPLRFSSSTVLSSSVLLFCSALLLGSSPLLCSFSLLCCPPLFSSSVLLICSAFSLVFFLCSALLLCSPPQFSSAVRGNPCDRDSKGQSQKTYFSKYENLPFCIPTLIMAIPCSNIGKWKTLNFLDGTRSYGSKHPDCNPKRTDQEKMKHRRKIGVGMGALRCIFFATPVRSQL